ncbi:hypothetical protein RB623_25165 [Mesorhizobium sp. LHD-90]|uniref:hypothetical protein n=1 Tax=Mesorhizobium sp. LHD-90 TaxID=3071414 RepID=UPI0027E0018A|nr:hypothetical protein [Mesorhizobium sp. LHD-90]MDQ6437357.1 hypothetical protein [Mesorhizobium sp. LHD-90]
MDKPIHPLATQHLPPFVTSPGETDVLFNVMVVVLIVMVLLLGAFYFRLHALPERMAHRANRTQIEIIGVLGLISLFTHNHLFWIAGLLLALIQFPDFRTPVVSIADSLNRIAGRYERRPPAADVAVPSAPADQATPQPPLLSSASIADKKV